MRPLKLSTTKQKKELVRIVWQQVEQFIKEWQKSPYEFEKERDIQVELVSRIKLALKSHKTYWAKFSKYILKGDESGQVYSRVCCEPRIYYKDNKSICNVCRPDIVIWDNLKNPSLPEEFLPKSGKNPHMLWICEIKYAPPWKTKEEERKNAWDLDKMKCLLKQKDLEYACWLHISFKRAKSGNGFKRTLLAKDRLRRYDIKLSALNGGSNIRQ